MYHSKVDLKLSRPFSIYFSLKERFRGQRQRKVDDMQIFFTFIPTRLNCFLSSLPHYQAGYLIFRKMAHLFKNKMLLFV